MARELYHNCCGKKGKRVQAYYVVKFPWCLACRGGGNAHASRLAKKVEDLHEKVMQKAEEVSDALRSKAEVRGGEVCCPVLGSHPFSCRVHG